ncbi:MAG: aldo/keto reductase [Gammaproteobacteria bacterium]|nr:aldo/keto reductase [Gammaproteobacteria bacterium]
MRTKTLGRTGLEVSIVGLGAMYSGKPANSGISTPDMDFELGVQTIIAAMEGGCTLVDTAYVYSRGGSEKIVGEALKRRPDLAAKCMVVTKVGYLGEGRDHSYDGILQAFEGSQERLGIEKFEIVYIHDAGGYPVEEVMSDDGALGAVRKLQNEGLIRWVGIACNDPEINTPFIVTGEFDAAVVPDAWSLLNQTAAEEILPAAEKYNMGISCATPLEIGLLATGPSRASAEGRRKFSPECLAHVGNIEDLCHQYGISLLAASLQWCTRHPQVACAIPGGRTPAEAAANAEAGSVDISEAFWDDLAPMVRHWEAGVDR